MTHPYDRNRHGSASANERSGQGSWERERDEAPNEERNMWQARTEDGGWGRGRRSEDEDARPHGGDHRFERGNERRFSDAEYGLPEGQGRRGFGTEIFGESGLGEQNRDPRRPSGDWGRGTDYARGFGPNHGFGYPSESASQGAGDYRRGFGYGFGAGGYASSGESRRGLGAHDPTGLDRDRTGARGEQGYGSRYGGYAGRGPKGYERTDARLREDVCDHLSQDDDVDASEITVRVESGEVTLEGSVETRHQKRQAEEVAAAIPGVRDVHNRVRVQKGLLGELKDKMTGEEPPTGGHAGSGTKTTSGAVSARTDHDQH